MIEDEGKLVRFLSLTGLLIPVRDKAGQLVALRVCPDAPGDGGKYRWINSRSNQYPDRPSPETPCHVPRGLAETVDTLRTTEGESKADAAFQLSGVPTIAIPGVISWSRILPLIEEFHPQSVLIGLDSDFRTNGAVATALQGLVIKSILSNEHSWLIRLPSQQLASSRRNMNFEFACP